MYKGTFDALVLNKKMFRSYRRLEISTVLELLIVEMIRSGSNQVK